jgi:hypothetical protein
VSGKLVAVLQGRAQGSCAGSSSTGTGRQEVRGPSGGYSLPRRLGLCLTSTPFSQAASRWLTLANIHWNGSQGTCMCTQTGREGFGVSVGDKGSKWFAEHAPMHLQAVLIATLEFWHMIIRKPAARVVNV